MALLPSLLSIMQLRAHVIVTACCMSALRTTRCCGPVPMWLPFSSVHRFCSGHSSQVQTTAAQAVGWGDLSVFFAAGLFPITEDSAALGFANLNPILQLSAQEQHKPAASKPIKHLPAE